MKIGVMADTHDHRAYTARAVEAFNAAGVEWTLHAGDFVAPFVVNELAGLQSSFRGIFGNNDGERLGLYKRLSEIGSVQVQPLFLELSGRRIAMIHEPEPVEAFAQSALYDLVIYAHTHLKETRYVGECLVLNPGEVCGWLTWTPTCAVVDLTTMTLDWVDLK